MEAEIPPPGTARRVPAPLLGKTAAQLQIETARPSTARGRSSVAIAIAIAMATATATATVAALSPREKTRRRGCRSERRARTATDQRGCECAVLGARPTVESATAVDDPLHGPAVHGRDDAAEYGAATRP